MSLRNLGVFAPLKPDHPLVIDENRCWMCGGLFAAGVRVGLNPVETPDETGSLTVRAEVVCGTCFLKGKTIVTPKGRRIVARIKEGDGSPYPVETTDGQQWKDDEVSSST